jgi:hypothetical protein
MSRCQRECQEFDPPILLHTNIMYKIYWTTSSGRIGWALTPSLNKALEFCETERAAGSSFVTMASDYPNMVGKPGASGPDSGYVPQMLN